MLARELTCTVIMWRRPQAALFQGAVVRARGPNLILDIKAIKTHWKHAACVFMKHTEQWSMDGTWSRRTDRTFYCVVATAVCLIWGARV